MTCMMKEIHKAYKFELRPTTEQQIMLNQTFGCTRWVYNHFLDEHNKQYKEGKKTDNYNTQAKKLTALKKQEDTQWLSQVNSQALQQSLKHLETAFKNFFEKHAKYPRFKSKKHRNSFTIPQHMKLVDNRVFFPKSKTGIKVIVHREVVGEIRSMTFSRTPTGKYFVSILTIQNHEVMPSTNKAIGIDRGITDLAILPDGKKFPNNRYTKRHEKQLAHAQKHLSRKEKGSNSFEKQRRKVAKIHEKIRNSRNDYLHKVSSYLVSEYDFLSLETLNVKGMLKNHRLAKHIADAAWSTLKDMIAYKAAWNNKITVFIDTFFPSSKKCCVCNRVNHDLDLSERIWTCKCGCVHDRDINAAINILLEGLRIYGAVPRTGRADLNEHIDTAINRLLEQLRSIGAGLVDYAGGEFVFQPDVYFFENSEKPEAHRSLAGG